MATAPLDQSRDLGADDVAALDRLRGVYGDVQLPRDKNRAIHEHSDFPDVICDARIACRSVTFEPRVGSPSGVKQRLLRRRVPYS